jgi:butyrate response factor 1
MSEFYFPHPDNLEKARAGGKKEKIEEKVDKTKYKTEMCKNWIEVGLCRYGNKCQFAHGGKELLGKAPPVNNIKYKSKTCSTFNEHLFCPYGQRCLFKHEDRAFE